MSAPTPDMIRRAVVHVASKIESARRWAYRRTFAPDGGRDRPIEIVLADLRDFCRAERSTFDLDPRVSDVMQGRRDVWLRINRYLNLDDAEVHRLVEVERD